MEKEFNQEELEEDMIDTKAKEFLKKENKTNPIHRNSCGDPIYDKDGNLALCCGDDLGGDNGEFAQCKKCREKDYTDIGKKI